MVLKYFIVSLLIFLSNMLDVNVHGDLSMDPRNRYYPFERRPLDYFDIRYSKAKATLRKLEGQRTVPSSIFSSRYKQFLDRKHALQTKYQLQKQGKSLDKSSKDYKVVQEYEQERRKEDEVRQIVRTIDDYRMKRYVRTIFMRSDYDMDDQQMMRPELMRSPYDMYWFEKELLNYYNFSWENLQFGLTLSEIERVLVIISFIRFCFYTVRYDAKSALIISVTAFICAILYEKMLVDVVGICYIRLYLSSSLFRLGFEQFLQFTHNERTYLKYSLESFRWFQIYPGWLIRLIINSPTLSGIQLYIDETVMPIVFQYIRIYRKPMESLIFYTLILRVGKKYVPYPLQWHGIVYVMYCQCIGDFIFNRFVASMEFLKDFLIPELRLEEIEIMEILQASFLSGFVYMLMLAMLHAVFSQYYYIPLLSLNIDAYIGKRPKDSIFSGGYSSWQDEQELFVPSKGDYKIWFGFLGKGTKAKKRKRSRPPKVSAQTNFLFLIIGLITFNFMWSVQTDNIQSLWYK
jgi:hypothetical protein